VIAIGGNQWHLQAVSLKKHPKICVKKSDHQNAAISTDFIRLKTLLFGKQAI